MDAIPPIKPVSGSTAIRLATPAAGAAPAGESFASTLSDAFATLNESQAEADRARMALASGQPVDLHDVMLTMEESSLNFQLGVTVRNKLVEAYQDIMRMQM